MAATCQPAFGLLPTVMPWHQEEGVAALPDQLLAVLQRTVQGSLQVQHLFEAYYSHVTTKDIACAHPDNMLAGSMPL